MGSSEKLKKALKVCTGRRRVRAGGKRACEIDGKVHGIDRKVPKIGAG